jgi:acyl carrier protein
MQRKEIVERITDIVVEQLGAEPDKVTEKTRYVEDLGADSLDLVELIMAFEDEFEASIPDTALEGIKCVGDSVDFILKQLA